ncbi:MAG: pyruvate formate lyase family protein [Verrucomicrobiota bacterium]
MKAIPENRRESVNPILDHPFSVELNFTRAHREASRLDPALREARCLRAMFPDALSPIEPSRDLFAGRFIATPGVDKVLYEWDARRHNIPSVGFLPLTPGAGASAGYYCHETVLRKKMDDLRPDAATCEELEAVIDYWKTHGLPGICRREYPDAMQEALPFDTIAGKESANPAHPLVRMTGPMYDNGKLVRLGLPGLRDAVAESAARHPENAALFEGMAEALDLVADVCRFYAAQARDLAADPNHWKHGAAMARLADILEGIAERPPASFHEAAQLVFIYGVVSGAYSWGRLDDALGGWLAHDFDAGVLTEEEALELLCSLWVVINDNGAPYDNRVVIGGRGRRDPAAADRFARLAMEATRRTRLPLPQLSLRFHNDQDPALYNLALTAIGEGCTFPILYNDDVNIPSVAHAMNVSPVEAGQYVPYGCGEYVLYGKSFGTPSGIFNHTKVLECLIRNGRERLTGRICGPQSGHLRDYRDFEELFAAYENALDYWIALMADQQMLEYRIVGRECRYLLWSILYDDCLEKGNPMFGGGLTYLGGTLESYGQINAGDSLLAIKKAVFEEKWCTADELIEALDRDFDGYDVLREKLLSVPKYGNNDPEADAMAVRIHETTCLKTRDQAARVGLDSYLIVIINNQANTVLGGHTLASADGRRAFDSLANANNAAPGMDRAGLTANLLSLVKLRPDLHAGAVQNLKLSPEWFSRRIEKLKALFTVYFETGAQLMVTVVNTDDLERAMAEPEKYPNLMVRVGGFSARFVELPPAVQREVLGRSLH